jgi:hypothetical protein
MPTLLALSAGMVAHFRCRCSCLLAVNAGRRGASKRVAVYIRLDTNGKPTVLGIPLGNGSVRNITLRTLIRLKVPVRVFVPSGSCGAPGWDTNLVQTMSAVVKAGLIPTISRQARALM